MPPGGGDHGEPAFELFFGSQDIIADFEGLGDFYSEIDHVLKERKDVPAVVEDNGDAAVVGGLAQALVDRFEDFFVSLHGEERSLLGAGVVRQGPEVGLENVDVLGVVGLKKVDHRVEHFTDLLGVLRKSDQTALKAHQSHQLLEGHDARPCGHGAPAAVDVHHLDAVIIHFLVVRGGRGLFGELQEFFPVVDLGDQNGLLYLGYAYLNGDGDITQDPVLAFDCFMKSASQGNAAAENMLGVSYENGEGTELDEELALYWYQEAAKHNNPNAQNNLANCYKYGWLGLDIDPEKAFELYKKAAEKGIVDAMFEVAEFYNASHLTSQKSVEWYKKAADAGHGDAMFELARKYENGWNVKQDLAKAQEFYEKAIVAGSERADNHEKEQEVLYQSWLDPSGYSGGGLRLIHQFTSK